MITTASAANHAYVRALGADDVVDYNARDFTQVVANCDAVFDTVGGEVAQRSFDAQARRTNCFHRFGRAGAKAGTLRCSGAAASR